MSLSVPPVTSSVTNGYAGYRGMQPPAATPTPPLSIDPATVQIEVKFDLNRQEITFDGAMLSAPVRNGDWIVITAASKSSSAITNSLSSGQNCTRSYAPTTQEELRGLSILTLVVSSGAEFPQHFEWSHIVGTTDTSAKFSREK